MRQTLFLLAMALCAACTREKAGNASASAYTSDSGQQRPRSWHCRDQ